MLDEVRQIESLIRGGLRSKIAVYKKKVETYRDYLIDHPNEWGRVQSEFNQEVNGIFRDLMLFEKEQFLRGELQKVEKLKNFFIKRFRSLFVHGDYLKWSLGKPFGYAGDFQIIDDIYTNKPKTLGFERLYDNYFQMSAICIAVRNRKEDFKRFILNKITKTAHDNINVLSLASGPCRDIAELVNHPLVISKKVNFHCYDIDPKSLEYGRNLIPNRNNVQFFERNAVKLALMKEISKKIEFKYDMVFSTGLFDYLNDKLTVRLLANLKRILKPGGVLAISDVRDKFSNPSIYFMEWVADWNLLYRGDDAFRSLFLEAGFMERTLSFDYEQQGMLQYVLAQNGVA